MNADNFTQQAIIRGLEQKLIRQQQAVAITEQHIAVLKTLEQAQEPALPLETKKDKK